MKIDRCPSCNNIILDSDKSCPNCGFNVGKGNPATYIILLVLLGLVTFYFLQSKGKIDTGSVIDDRNTYSVSWSEPNQKELRDIGIVISKNNIHKCGEYFIKEVTKNEYVIACTSDGENWNYYVVYPTLNEIYLASVEMLKELKPPY